jgi:hypothetical protein
LISVSFLLALTVGWLFQTGSGNLKKLLISLSNIIFYLVKPSNIQVEKTIVDAVRFLEMPCVGHRLVPLAV